MAWGEFGCQGLPSHKWNRKVPELKCKLTIILTEGTTLGYIYGCAYANVSELWPLSVISLLPSSPPPLPTDEMIKHERNKTVMPYPQPCLPHLPPPFLSLFSSRGLTEIHFQGDECGSIEPQLFQYKFGKSYWSSVNCFKFREQIEIQRMHSLLINYFIFNCNFWCTSESSDNTSVDNSTLPYHCHFGLNYILTSYWTVTLASTASRG